MPDPRSFFFFFFFCVPVVHQFQSAEWRDRTALLVHPSTLFDSDVRRFQQARGNESDPYGEWHETIWAHKAPGTLGEMSPEGNPTVSDECLVLVAPVSSDVLIWTADDAFYIHILYLAHGQPRVQGIKCSTFRYRNPGGPYRPRCIRRLMVS